MIGYQLHYQVNGNQRWRPYSLQGSVGSFFTRVQDGRRGEREKVSIFILSILMHLSMSSRRVGGSAWGGDLIVLVGLGVGHLNVLVLPGEEIFESFFARRALGSIARFNILQYQSNWELYFQNRKLYQFFKRHSSRGR